MAVTRDGDESALAGFGGAGFRGHSSLPTPELPGQVRTVGGAWISHPLSPVSPSSRAYSVPSILTISLRPATNRVTGCGRTGLFAGRVGLVVRLGVGPGISLGGRAAGAAHLPGAARHPPRVAESPAEQELDLGISGSHLVGRPLGQGVVDGRIESQQDALAVSHRRVTRRASRCSPPAA